MSPEADRNDQREGLRYALICGCFTLSGLAALVYQTAWTRQFALVFGTSDLAVATVLAAYMGGLALGARCIEHLLPRVRSPVRLYALLELAIGVAALLLVPACLWLAERLLIQLLGGQDAPASSGAAGNTLFYLCAAFVTLLIPTTLMGATLPLLVRDGVHSDRQIGARIGKLYACNTAGAVLGALLAAIVLLPQLGLRATVWTAAAANCLVFVLAWLSLRMGGEPNIPATGVAPVAPASFAAAFTVPGVSWILPLILVSGSISFLHEVLWTRLLQRVVGSSIQAFGVMVASFLTGIALGGALGARLARERATASRWFVVSQASIAVAAVAAWYALQAWAGLPTEPWQRVLFGLLLLLPLSFAIGVTYPLAVRILTVGVADAPAVSARVYTWNTAGAIAGALAGGFWILPALRYEGTVQFAVLASLALALGAGVLLTRPTLRQAAPAVAIALLVGVLFQPAVPEALLRISPLRNGKGRITYYAVGRSADVVVVQNESLLELRTNGLPEAASPVLGAPPTANVEAWMSMLAVLARPDTSKMLVVGFGGGNVVQAVPPAVGTVDVIELEPAVIAANRAIAPLRMPDPLADARINIITNDARGALALSSKRYDAIVSQPSHPWTAGASHLYTREFMQQAHSHLNPRGVFVQWMGAEFTDETLMRSLVATLLDVFKEVRVYRPSNTTLLYMASDSPIEPERHLPATRAALDRSPLHYGRLGLNAPEDLVASLALQTGDARKFSAGAALITDNDNRLATANVYERRLGMNSEKVAALLAPYDPLTQPDSFVYQELAADISFEYIWRRAVLWAAGDTVALERMNRVADALGDSDRSQLLRFMMAMHLKQPVIARQLLDEGLKRWPDSVPLLYASAESELAPLAQGKASELVVRNAAKLQGEPALVVAVTQAASRQQWDEVSSADDQLAQISWTAQWGLQAARLRTEWRIRIKDPDLRQRYGNEGIAIADRAEVTQPDVFWHSLRAWSASGTNRPEVMLESVAAFCTTAEQIKSKLAASELAMVRDRAVALQGLLQQLKGDSRVDGARYKAVREHLAATLDLLQ